MLYVGMDGIGLDGMVVIGILRAPPVPINTRIHSQLLRLEEML